jgi:hypothetical protein
MHNIMLARAEVQQKFSLKEFGGAEAIWQTTEEAKALFEKIRAHKVQQKICNRRSEELAEKGRRCLSASFMKFFITSRMGLGIKDIGAGKRDGKLQTNFRKDMINAYGSQHKNEDLLWCPIIGKWNRPQGMRAAHLFAYIHRQTP